MMSDTTPLPKARPLASLDQEDQTAQFGAGQMPTAQIPPSRAPAPSVLTSIPPVQRSIPSYTIPPGFSSRDRRRKGSRCVVRRRFRSIALPPIRSEPRSLRARPTRPAPLAPTLKPGRAIVDSPLDAELLGYLSRIAR